MSWTVLPELFLWIGRLSSWCGNLIESSSVTTADNNSPLAERSHTMEGEEPELTENVDTVQSTRNGNIRMNVDSSRENDAVDPGRSIRRHKKMSHFREHESLYVFLCCIGEKTTVLLMCCGQLTFAHASLLTLCIYRESVSSSLQAWLLTVTTFLSILITLLHIQKSMAASNENMSRTKKWLYYIGMGPLGFLTCLSPALLL